MKFNSSIYYGACILAVLVSCMNNAGTKQVSSSTDIKKWEKAVVNIECRESRYTPEEIDELIAKEKLQGRLETEEEELEKRTAFGRETDPVSSTAVYLTDKGKKYLVTARHAIFDERESMNTSFPRLFKDISIRTPFDYFLKKKVNNSSIPSTGYGSASPFYLSSEVTDIGIISLQASLTRYLIETLEEDGYVPITMYDIDSLLDIHAGEEIAAIGYPDISQVGFFQRRNDYQSNVVVLPVSTFGNIAMTHKKLSYLIGDITVYPGNSGGPVIKNNKMIGIVSGQVLIPLQNSPNAASRGTLAKIIKTSDILEGLRILQRTEADKFFH